MCLQRLLGRDSSPAHGSGGFRQLPMLARVDYTDSLRSTVAGLEDEQERTPSACPSQHRWVNVRLTGVNILVGRARTGTLHANPWVGSLLSVGSTVAALRLPATVSPVHD